MNAESAKLAQKAAFASNVVEGTFEFQGKMYNFKATPKQETKMNDQHRATDSEWHCIKVRGCGSKADVVAYSTIHELLCRIEALEATQRAVAHPSTNRIHLGLGDTPQNGSIDLSHLSDAEREKILKLLANPGTFEVLEVAQPAKPDSSLVERVADAIVAKATSAGIVNDRPARAAIGVIVGELRAQCWVDVADWLEQEAEQ